MLKTPDSVAGEELRERLSAFDDDAFTGERRSLALERFFTTPSGRQRPGPYWKIDIETLSPSPPSIAKASGSVLIDNSNARLIACDLATAAREHPALLGRALGATRVQATKFGALATAFQNAGVFVYVPADAATDEPVVITYNAPDGASLFPYTIVLAERGARATVVERLEGGAEAFVCGATEIVTGEGAEITYAGCQQLAASARVVQTRAALPGRDASVAWACAELGAGLTITDLSVAIERPGAEARITALFFPKGSQHVDVVSTVDHVVGESTSQTIVKSAAVDDGQARYLGNIRIAPRAQGSDASLRDDALLLSARAHIDSVPALEIGANDVKAFHGATVGALDADQIFYMETRGIERNAAERMIALGFFEPAIAHFPTDALRAVIRTALAAKFS